MLQESKSRPAVWNQKTRKQTKHGDDCRLCGRYGEQLWRLNEEAVTARGTLSVCEFDA